jgi:hypothetical protein
VWIELHVATTKRIETSCRETLRIVDHREEDEKAFVCRLVTIDDTAAKRFSRGGVWPEL